jgi:non-specific serine/threonine protein kinase
MSMRHVTQQPLPPSWPAVVPARPGESLVGRRQELADLRQLLGSARLVTLTGPGGIGKTTLARAAAAEHERARRESTWRVDLHDLVDPDLLGHAVAGAFGIQLPHGAAATHGIAAAVADRAGLLVLDGCEAMLGEAVDLAAGLLAATPRLRVLATSQQALGVTGEVVVPVGPLVSDDARALFTARATATLPSFRLTEDNAVAVAGICDALEGMPLAVELAAARVLVLSPQGILDRLDDRQRLLTKGARDAPARQRSLRASLEASSELCTPEERLLWARLSVFNGGFPLEAAEVVCTGDGIDGTDVLDLVDGLLEKSLLVREEDDGGSCVRFRMLETLREYAAAHLTPEQQRAGRDRHLAWYADLVRAAADASFGPGQAEWYRTLSREHGNVRQALRHAVDEPRHAVSALEMVTALEQYWGVSGRLGEARLWLARASAVAEADAATRTRALAMTAWTATLQGDPTTARSALDEAADLLADGDQGGDARARVLVARAVEAVWRGDPAEALPHLERAVRAAHTSDQRSLESTALFLLAVCRGLSGDLDGAGTALRTCVDLTGAAGEVHLRSHALAMLGVLKLRGGDPEAAAGLEREALAMKMDLGDRSATALVLEVLAWAAATRRRAERAATLLGAADARWRHLGVDPDAVPYLSDIRRGHEARAGIDRGDADFRAAFRRGAVLSDEQVLGLALEQAPAEEAPGEEVPLTRRECEVAQLVGYGLSNREIAEKLLISQRTVESHVEHILRKLGFGSRTQVVAWVVQRETRP